MGRVAKRDFGVFYPRNLKETDWARTRRLIKTSRRASFAQMELELQDEDNLRSVVMLLKSIRLHEGID